MTTQATPLRTADIRRISEVLETLFRQGDDAGRDDLYTEHGARLRTNIDATKNTNEIRVFWREATGTGIRDATLDVAVIDRHGDTVIGVGQYLLTGAGEEVVDQGRYIVIWKRAHGQWKLHLDIWSTRPLPTRIEKAT